MEKRCIEWKTIKNLHLHASLSLAQALLMYIHSRTTIDPPSDAAWAPTTLGCFGRVKRLRALWKTETPRTAPGNWWLVQLRSSYFHRETLSHKRGTHGPEMLLGSSMLVPRNYLSINWPQEKTTSTSPLRNFTGKRSHFPDLSAGNRTDVSALSSSEHHGPRTVSHPGAHTRSPRTVSCDLSLEGRLMWLMVVSFI